MSAFPVADTTDVELGLVLRDVTVAKQLALLQERERIAMDLHDGVIQSLYGMALGLAACERALAAAPEATRQALCRAIEQTNGVIQQVRDYIVGLRRQLPGDQDLRSGLAALAEELQASGLIRPELALDADLDTRLDLDGRQAVLYIAREAVANILRHAGASTVLIRLATTDEQLVLTIRDNGRGFALEQIGHGIGEGLGNMRARATGLGGRLVIASQPGCGTEVHLEVPVCKEGRNHGGTVEVAARG